MSSVREAAERLRAKSERAFRWLATVETYTMGERLVLDMQEALADLLSALAAARLRVEEMERALDRCNHAGSLWAVQGIASKALAAPGAGEKKEDERG